MTDKLSQSQKSGSGSVNIQTGALTVGVSYTEARQIALDVYRVNALELANTAKETARKRAEEITDEFLQKLQAENAAGIGQAANPDFQIALYDAQKAYAKTGDKELGRLLVDLLVGRTKEPARSLREIVLSESLQVVPRLTPQQLHAIAVIFLVRYTQNSSISAIDHLRDWFNRVLRPFIESLTKARSCYLHLAYSGAVTLEEISSLRFGNSFKQNYPGLFCVGHPRSKYERYIAQYPGIESMLGPAAEEPSNFQLPPVTRAVLSKSLAVVGVPEPVCDELWNLQTSATRSPEQIEKILGDKIDDFERLADIWNGSLMKNSSLTSVGLAIGHATFQQVTGQQAELAIWIPD